MSYRFLEHSTDAIIEVNAKAFGENLDLKKHNFKVEIKAPTFYDMEIKTEDSVYMRFLLDL
ncbi:archease [Nitrosopumilus sp.]|nr:archease [Nitrosopumilus sp.]